MTDDQFTAVTLEDIAAYFAIGDDPEDWAGQIRAIQANAAAEVAELEAELEAERAALRVAAKGIDGAMAELSERKQRFRGELSACDARHRRLTEERDQAREWGIGWRDKWANDTAGTGMPPEQYRMVIPNRIAANPAPWEAP